MKKLVILFLVLVSALSSFAQVPINYDGNTTPALNGTPSAPAHVKILTAKLTGGTIKNIHDCIIDGAATDISGTINTSNLKNVTFINFFLHDISGPGFAWSGNNQNIIERHFRCESVEGNVNEASYNQTYDGTVNTLNFYNFRLDSSFFRGSGILLFGSWGAPGQPGVGFIDSVVLADNTVYNQTSNGTDVRGIIYRGHMDRCLRYYDSSGAWSLGDVGAAYVYGEFSGSYNISIGVRGYWDRLWPTSLNGRMPHCVWHDNIRVNATTYGANCVTNAETDGALNGKYTSNAGGDFWDYNNTQYNISDGIGYWCPELLSGGLVGAFSQHQKNNLGVRVLEPGMGKGVPDTYNKSKWWVNQASDGSGKIDSSGNSYFPVNNNIVSATGKKIANLPGIGATPIISAAVVLPGSGTVTPPVDTTTKPTVCPTISVDSILKAHPCPVCPAPIVVDSAAIINAYLASHPCPACPPPVVCPVIQQRRVTGVSFNGVTITIYYDDKSISSLP